MPVISVIVPVYNVESYLHRCINSVLQQSFADFEVILIDDGSPDGSPAICDQYARQDTRVKVIHQQNGGLSAARNAGIDWVFAHSDSDWITFIDSDDWVHPEYLASLYNAVVKNNVFISVCGYIETAGETPEIVQEKLYAENWTPENFFVKNPTNAVIACGKLYKKECFENIRYPIGKIHEDEFTTYKILFRYPYVAVLNFPFYFYYQNNGSIMRSGWSPKNLEAYTAIEEQIIFFDKNGFDIAKRSVIRRYLMNIKNKCDDVQTYGEYARFFKKKKRKYFKAYSKQLDVKDDADAWVLTQVFPVRMKLYWKICSIFKKLRLGM